MKKIIERMVMAWALALPVMALANGSPQTKAAMENEGCFACHAVSHKVIGPAYGWIAYVFAHKPGAAKELAQKIVAGGAGRWNAWTGGMPMLPHPDLSLGQAEEMATWVLAQTPIAPPEPCQGGHRPVPIPGLAQPSVNAPCRSGQ